MASLINKVTARHIKRLASSDASVILITGPTGSGKSKAAIELAENILGIEAETAINKGQLLSIDGQTAGIEDVRAIIKRISIKAGSSRVYIINNTDSLGHEAQNALLKTLEQLPASTKFIMTATRAGGVLATIRSRAASFNVQPVSLAEARDYFDAESKDVDKYWNMSGGLAGELVLLMKKDSPLDAAVNDAKLFLSLNTYERLIFIEKYASNRDNLTLFLEALGKVLKAATNASVQKNQTNLKRLVHARKTLLELLTAVSANASLKLVSLKLATSLEV